MVMTAHTQNSSSKVSGFKRHTGNKRTNRRTLAITLPSRLARSVKSRRKRAPFITGKMCAMETPVDYSGAILRFFASQGRHVAPRGETCKVNGHKNVWKTEPLIVLHCMEKWFTSIGTYFGNYGRSCTNCSTKFGVESRPPGVFWPFGRAGGAQI